MNFSGNISTSTYYLSGAQRLFMPDLPTIHKTGHVFAEQSDLTGIHHVLDLAAGDGAWAISAAQTSPHIQIVAIESNPQLAEQARVQAQQHGVENISFQVIDSSQQLEAASFDLVNLRFMLGFTDLDQWPKLMDESLRLLRPGGIMRLTEADTLITTSAACERLSDLLSQALWKEKRHLFPPTPYGQNLLITPLLPRLLRDAGCEQIKSMAFTTNFSTDMPAHTEMIQNIIRSFELVQPLLLPTATEEEKQEITSLIHQMHTEILAEDFCGIEFYLTAWGRKHDPSLSK